MIHRQFNDPDIESVHYDPRWRTLDVKMRHGTVRRFLDVAEERVALFITSEDKRCFFDRNVVRRHRESLVESTSS